MSPQGNRTKREIIKIDEEKCDGCGRCVTACTEGAIAIVDGKARLVSETYCDGLGACIGDCPRGALTIETREADVFDEEAVQEHLASDSAKETSLPETGGSQAAGAGKMSGPTQTAGTAKMSGASRMPGAGKPAISGCAFTCPGSASQVLDRSGEAEAPAGAADGPAPAGASNGSAPAAQLGQWPVQLHLVPVNAPYFQDADLLISADCAPFAFADFHRKFLRGRALVVGCPKLDDVDAYRRKLTEIFRQNEIRMIEVAHMEVPCCFGLVRLVETALQDSGKAIPLVLTRIGIRGEILERSQPATSGRSASSQVSQKAG
jgi:NAD-dependent dihydropyrimidine dehydrogenase PreA subunit